MVDPFEVQRKDNENNPAKPTKFFYHEIIAVPAATGGDFSRNDESRDEPPMLIVHTRTVPVEAVDKLNDLIFLGFRAPTFSERPVSRVIPCFTTDPNFPRDRFPCVV